MGFFDKLKQSLQKTKESVLGQVNNIIKTFRKVDEDFLEELEEILIAADVGVATSEAITDRLREEIKVKKVSDSEDVKQLLQDIIADIMGENEGMHLNTSPSCILIIGVNGAGKTTSIGKIANVLQKQGKKVVVAAGDTFRAAAIDQLQVWADRADVDIVRHQEGGDPAAVVYDAIASAKSKNCDVLIIDTAGRLHNKKNLMDELAKINRVIDRELPNSSRETLLVLDATTGQNAINQAKEFKNTANITGIILAKLDSSAKGGAVISIKKELNIPIKFVGVGEKIDDLEAFDSREYVKALFE